MTWVDLILVGLASLALRGRLRAESILRIINTAIVLAWLVWCPTIAFAATGPQVRVMISVDWEGDPISEQQENLAAFAAFRKEFPQIPLVQFLNAAHFTRPGANPVLVKQAIESVLDRQQDELGLHIHGWKSLVQAAGVRYRSVPTITTAVPKDTCKGAADCGYWVQIKHYSAADLASMIAASRRILRQNGFDGLVSFRAGAWLMNAGAYQALSQQGMVYDHSEVDWRYVQAAVARGGAPLASFAPWARQLQAVWPQADPLHQPYPVRLPKGIANPVLEIPNNGALADYTTAEEFIGLFDAAVLKASRSQAPVVLSVGFHMETASEFIGRIRALCQHVEQYGKIRPGTSAGTMSVTSAGSDLKTPPAAVFITSKGAF